MPVTKVGLLDEHGPSLVLPSYSHECIADWIRSDADLLRNAFNLLHSHAAAAAASDDDEGGARSPLQTSQMGSLGRLDSTYFLPIGHGGKDMTISFNFWFPPPYRVVLLLALGLLCYASNLHLLARLALDPATLPHFHHSDVNPTRSSSSSGGLQRSDSGSTGGSGLPRHTPSAGPESTPSGGGSSSSFSSASRQQAATFLGLLYAGLGLFGWLFFRYWVDGPPQGDPFGNHAQFYQAIVFFGCFLLALWPGPLVFPRIRRTFWTSLVRILQPSLTQRISFGDLLLADSLTSFAKVLGDVWLSVCFLWPRREHHTWWNGKGSFAVPVLTSLPYLIRLRQCLSEYRTSAPNVRKSKGGSSRRRSRKPLLNALKYASALPVIWLSTMHEMAMDAIVIENDARVLAEEDLDSLWLRKYGDSIFQFWLLFVFINSFFSFYWDVTNDWGLDLLRFSTWSSTSSPSSLTSSAAAASASSSAGIGTQATSAVGRLRQSLHKRGLSTNAYANRRASWRLSSLLSPITSSTAEEERFGGAVPAEQEGEGESSLLPSSPQAKVVDEGGVHQRTANLTTPSTPHFTLALSDQGGAGRVTAGREAGAEMPLGDAPSSGSSGEGRRSHTKGSPSYMAGLKPPSSSSASSIGGGHQRKRSAVLLRNPEKGVSMLFQPTTYQIIVVLDLILRFLWSIKLSSHLHHIVELEAGVFFIEALEIVRRWAWVFLRVEWEFVRHHRLHGSSDGAASSSSESQSHQLQQSHYLGPPSPHASSNHGATIPSPIAQEPLLHKGE